MDPSQLGPITRTFRPRPWPLWLTPAGVLTGALAVSFSLGGDGLRIVRPGAFAIGVVVIAASIVAPFWHRRTSARAWTHEHGLRVLPQRRLPWGPRGAREVRWDAVVRFIPEYRFVRVGGTLAPGHRFRIYTAEPLPLTLTMASCRDAESLMRAIEADLAPRWGAVLEAQLAEGGVVTVGTHHLTRQGWMIENNLVPWKALSGIRRVHDRVIADFAVIGSYSLGLYSEVPAAWATLTFVVGKAREQGGAAALFDDVPAAMA